MTCQENLIPYIRWAAQQQFTDPNRYLVGISLVSTSEAGRVAIVYGYADIIRARFSPDGERFITSLRGVGEQRQTSTEAYFRRETWDDDPRKVIIQIDANHEGVRVRIGDVELREVVEDFRADCVDKRFVGVSNGFIHVMNLQYVEQVDGVWLVNTTVIPVQDDVKPVVDAHVEDTVETEAVTAVPDDLQKIEGIGPKSATALNRIGINTYVQLAGYDPQTLLAELDAAGEDIGLNSVRTWPAQAALAAAGRWNALKYIQDELLSSGRLSLPDNLQRINGIGPAVAEKLDRLGITTFKQIAEADPDQLEANLRAEGARIQIGAAATWPAQASLAQAGNWLELETYQHQLRQMDEGLNPEMTST